MLRRALSFFLILSIMFGGSPVAARSISGGIVIGPAGVLPTSFGLSQSSGRSALTTAISEIVGDGRTSVTVGGAASLTGATILSQSGDLTVKAKSLAVADLVDFSRQSGFSVGVSGLDKLLGGTSGDPKTPGGSSVVGGITLGYDSVAQDGKTFTVIGKGSITIGGEQNPAVLGSIKRDLDGRQVLALTDDTHFSLDLPLIDAQQLAANARSVGDFARAITAQAPDEVRALGPSGENYFRRLVAAGLDSGTARTQLDSPAIQQRIQQRDTWQEAVDYWGGPDLVPPQLRNRIALDGNADITDPTGNTVCGGGGTNANCYYTNKSADQASVLANAKDIFFSAADTYKQLIGKSDRTAEEIVALENAKAELTTAYTAYALCIGSLGDASNALFRAAGLSTYPGTAALQQDARKTVQGGIDQDIGERQAQNRIDFVAAASAIEFGIKLTPAGAFYNGYALYQDATNGNYYAAAADGALLAVDLTGLGIIVKAVVKAGEKVAIKEGVDLLSQSVKPDPGNINVYQAVGNDGKTTYVGITNDLDRRAAQHYVQKGIEIEEITGLSNISASDARAVEQALIELNGLGKNGGTLLNKINSIAQSNPIYATSIKRGNDILQGIGYLPK